jgi:hypothetical protein
MGCNCGKNKTPTVLPSLVAADGKVTQYETQPEALAAQARIGGELRWLPKHETGS